MSKSIAADPDDYLSILRALREYEAQGAAWPALRWAVVANTTLEPMAPFVRHLTFEAHRRPDIWFGGFDTALQDALDDTSGLFVPAADVVVVALRLDGLAPALVHRFAALSPEAVRAEAVRAVDYVSSIIGAIRNRSRALMLVHAFETPVHPELGVIDYGRRHGQVNTIRQMNLDVVNRASAHAGVLVVDLDTVRGRLGYDAFVDPRTWQIGRVAYTRQALGAIAAEYGKAIRALLGQNRKCVVVDADNTLWGGVVGDDGVEGIEIGRTFPGSAFVDFQQALLALRDRGVLLALCSKNDSALVSEAFTARAADMPLRLDDFAAVRVNWADKAQNLREIADELNLGVDSFVFVDDNPFEVDLVRQLLPGVYTLALPPDPGAYRDLIARCGLFDALSFSAEDRERAGMYDAERQRREGLAAATVDDYLRGLAMDVEIANVDDRTASRVAQLTQKTNQFNLTTRRYSEADIRAMAQSSDLDVVSVRLTDRLGDSGIVGVAILKHDGRRSTVDTLLLSCRVLGRGVEDALLAACVRLSAGRGCEEIVGRYIPTEKNARVRDFYSARGFDPNGAEGSFVRRVGESTADPFPAHIRSVTLNGERVAG